MAKKLLSDKFFNDNPLEEISAAAIANFHIRLPDEAKEQLNNISREVLKEDKERAEKLAAEQERIEAEQSPEVLLDLMRKVDNLNQEILVYRALTYEDEIMPMVVKKLLRSDHDIFIEISVRLLAKSKKDYIPQLVESYGKIRSPYVRSMVCMLVGFREDKSMIPWLYDRYMEMKGKFPGEGYEQGPLRGLYDMDERFG